MIKIAKLSLAIQHQFYVKKYLIILAKKKSTDDNEDEEEPPEDETIFNDISFEKYDKLFD